VFILFRKAIWAEVFDLIMTATFVTGTKYLFACKRKCPI